jgi:adenylosuccinate lyase
MIDALNGPMTAATQWLERSLDDSANRRLVLPEAFLLADAILGLAAGIATGIQVNQERVRFHVERELPFMATETLLMKATVGGGDRQELHELIRKHSMTAHAAVAAGGENPLIGLLVEDQGFHLESTEIESILDPIQYTGRASEQVTEFLNEIIDPALEDIEIATVVEPRV